MKNKSSNVESAPAVAVQRVVRHWRTFQQWNDAGYLIKKGEKATMQNGAWVFSENQIREKPPQREYVSGWDSADDLNTCGGPRYGIYGNCD